MAAWRPPIRTDVSGLRHVEGSGGETFRLPADQGTVSYDDTTPSETSAADDDDSKFGQIDNITAGQCAVPATNQLVRSFEFS